MLRYIHDRITVHPDLCGGKPTIRGKRLTVQTVLEFLAAGDKPEEILEDYDFLELADIEACQHFALKTALEALHHRVYLPAAA
ncbi:MULTISPECIES: DUF433 domain-containing protein [Hymenobacter]|uniref:DUF433 domain-containing protein n=1 Tax=Hymenobacter TaxID=89966 RepID=UPI0012469921|nr:MULTISPECIES: DUF433 domain-containing protein [Hymenobacter]QKG54109.1 DUF433 domain-containing protein [Hymenobacter sp. BRD67]